MKKNTVLPRKEPQQLRSQFTVDAILEAAARIIAAEEDQQKVNTSRIAEKAGVSVGSLYQYFPGKDALVSTLIRRFVAKRFQEIEPKIREVEAMDLEAGCHQLAGMLIELELKHSKLANTLFEWFVRVGDLKLVTEVDLQAEAAIAESLQRLAPKTRKLDPEFAAFALFQVCRTFLSQCSYRRSDDLGQPWVQAELGRLIFGYLRP